MIIFVYLSEVWNIPLNVWICRVRFAYKTCKCCFQARDERLKYKFKSSIVNSILLNLRTNINNLTILNYPFSRYVTRPYWGTKPRGAEGQQQDKSYKIRFGIEESYYVWAEFSLFYFTEYHIFWLSTKNISWTLLSTNFSW